MLTVFSRAEVYTPRSPRKNQYYRCVEAHFEELEGTWEDRYQKEYGYWRPYVLDVIYKYLDCGDLHLGFARVKCDDCNHEYLLPFSCKRRHFCPSCHQKRVVEFGEFLYGEVLKQVPHRQWVFSIPKRLRLYFMYDRRLLVKLSQCAWKVLSVYLKQGVSLDAPNPGAVIAVQTFGDFLNFNPHLHIIATDGCFDQDGGFMVGAVPDASVLEGLFRLEVFNMLKKEGKITDLIIENMMGWHHSGFNVYCGEAIRPSDQEGIERLAQYIVRAPIAQERLFYIPASESNDGVARVIYKGKNSGVRETFVALDWLARLVTHIPNRGEQLVRYYGYYSNKSRGMRKKTETDNQAPVLVDSDISKKAFRKNWARLIQKVYHTDPLLCPKCNGSMRIISFIEEEKTIKKILLHLDLWMPGNHDPPNLYQEQQYIPASKPSGPSYDTTHDDYVLQMPYEDEYSQLTPYEDCI
ncbi:MAG: transposase [Dehalococcoidales bacterium]|nr:transposase [Dehalococcoidales bacterium]